MPGAPDKIIINGNGGGGLAALIESDFKTLRTLGEEIIANDMLKETVDLRDKMKGLCADHYKAEMVYHDGLKAMIEEIAERIDKKLGL